MKRLRKGSAVIVTGKPEGWRIWPEYYHRGTVTDVKRFKARVLFPIRSFIWLPKGLLKVVGYDGDGSSVHWR